MNKEIIKHYPPDFTIKFIHDTYTISFEVFEVFGYSRNLAAPEDGLENVIYKQKGYMSAVDTTDDINQAEKCFDGLYKPWDNSMYFHPRTEEIMFSSREDAKRIGKLIDGIYDYLEGRETIDV